VSAYPWKWPSVRGRIVAGPLRRTALPGSRSRILATTEGRVWLFSIQGGRGWFSKDDEHSLRRGRALCDQIIHRHACQGFITTDELPQYGLSRRDRAALFDAYPDADPTRDVLVALAYDDLHLAERIRADIVEELNTDSELV